MTYGSDRSKRSAEFLEMAFICRFQIGFDVPLATKVMESMAEEPVVLFPFWIVARQI